MKKFIAISLLLTMGLATISGCNKKLSDTNAPSGIDFTMPSVTESTPEETEKAPETFEELYGPQLVKFLDHQYVFEGKEIPKQEFNFYLVDSFIELSNYATYGYLPATYQGFLDLSADYINDDFKTCGNYLVDYTEKTLERIYILNKLAEDNEITISDESKANIDSVVDDFKTSMGITSDEEVDKYLKLCYGPDMTEEMFREIFKRFYIADAYSKYYCANYNFKESDKTVPNVKYVLFYAPDTVDQTTKSKAYDTAVTFKNAAKTSEDMLKLAESNDSAYDYGEVTVSKGVMVERFEEWAYQSHTEGDFDIVYAPEYGYFVVQYLGTKELSQEELDNIAINDLNNAILSDIKNKKYKFYTNDAYYPVSPIPTPTTAPKTANDIYNEMYNNYLDE